VPNDSSSSVVIRFANPDRIRREVAKYARNIREERPEVRRIIWFGSWVNGSPVPGSDVDLCLILSHSDLPIRARIPLYLPSGFPVGLDLFAYTEAEFAALAQNNSGWHDCIMSGKEI
jgi:uncharacterized protein